MADVNQLSALLASFVNQQSQLLASFRSQASSSPSPQPSQTFNLEQFNDSKEDFKISGTELVTLIENHLCPQPNGCIEQHKFLSRMLAANETIAQYNTVAL
ncbi:hypothetical protein ILUMI_15415, partial [Ignelater luminosus]